MPPLTLEEILAQQQGQFDLPTLIAAATAGGLGRTDLNALMNPQLAYGTGVIPPEALQRGMQQYVEAQQATAAGDISKEIGLLYAGLGSNPRENADSYQRVTLNTVANYNAANAGFSDTDKAEIDLAIQAAQRGGDTDVIATNLRRALGQSNVPTGRNTVRDGYINSIIANLPTIQTEADTYKTAVEEWDQKKKIADDTATVLERTYVAPDAQALRSEYYSDQGVPLMGMLPDPSNRYQFDLNAIAGWGDTASRLERDLSRASEQAQSTYTTPDVFSMKPQAQNLSNAQQALDEYNKANQAFNILLGERLAKKGVTPYEDAMRQLVGGYGLLEANA